MNRMAVAILSGLALAACGPSMGYEKAATRAPTAPKLHPDDYRRCGGDYLEIGLVQPNAFLVLDRSASMLSATDSSGQTRRWDDLKSAISNLVVKFDNGVRFGMSLFSRGDQCDPGIIDVPIGEHSGESLLHELSKASPAGTTPTGATLDYVRQHAGLNDPTRPNVVVLATDGVPSCGGIDVVSAITALYNSNPPVRTFVIGIGAETASEPGLLDSWAVAGHTDRDGPVQYYPSSSSAELTQSFEGIMQGLRDCTFGVPKPPATLSKIYVEMGGQWLPRNNWDGFDYLPEEGVVKLSGPTCDTFKLDPSQQLNLVYGCPDTDVL